MAVIVETAFFPVFCTSMLTLMISAASVFVIAGIWITDCLITAHIHRILHTELVATAFVLATRRTIAARFVYSSASSIGPRATLGLIVAFTTVGTAMMIVGQTESRMATLTMTNQAGNTVAVRVFTAFLILVHAIMLTRMIRAACLVVRT